LPMNPRSFTPTTLASNWSTTRLSQRDWLASGTTLATTKTGMPFITSRPTEIEPAHKSCWQNPPVTSKATLTEATTDLFKFKRSSDIVEVACWVHCRRYWHKAREQAPP